MANKLDLYKDWAFEILELIDGQYQLTDYTKETIEKLAIKLKTDLEDSIMSEWFCAGCDHARENP